MKKINAIVLALVFTAKNSVSKFLGAGTHLVSITEAVTDEAKGDDTHKDRTPQLKVTFMDRQQRIFSAWYNLKGYKKYDELTAKEKQSGKFGTSSNGFAIDAKTKVRIENKDNTAAAMSIIGRLGVDCGIEEGVDFEPEDLVGKELGIKIEPNDQNNLRIKYGMLASKVEVADEQEEAA